jgi:hypothetical protein
MAASPKFTLTVSYMFTPQGFVEIKKPKKMGNSLHGFELQIVFF